MILLSFYLFFYFIWTSEVLFYHQMIEIAEEEVSFYWKVRESHLLI